MNKKTLASILMCTILSVVLTPTTPVSGSHQEERRVGVPVDGWARYGNITVKWSSSDPYAKPDQSLIEANKTAWFEHIVTETVVTTVRFKNITHFKDGREKVNNAWIDVATGFGNGTLMFISADIHEGDAIYTKSSTPAFINKTLIRIYGGSKREVNNLNLTITNRIEDAQPQVIRISISHYWDKATGILVERRGSFINQTEDFLTSWYKSDIILETNLWFPELNENATNTNETFRSGLLIIAVVTLLSALILYWKRSKKSTLRKHRSLHR